MKRIYASNSITSTDTLYPDPKIAVELDIFEQIFILLFQKSTEKLHHEKQMKIHLTLRCLLTCGWLTIFDSENQY